MTASIATTAELSNVDLSTIEKLIFEVCTHLIAAGVMKQIVDYENETKNEFSVSIREILGASHQHANHS